MGQELERVDEGQAPPRRRWRRRVRLVLAAVLVALSVPLVCDLVVGSAAVVHTDPLATPHRRIALVLGTSPTIHGRPNLFFGARVRAAAELFEAGAVDGILVSGDNGRADYDEPTAMRDALVELGVPAEYVTRDHAGFRTLDSVVRAKEVFGLDRFTVVSQGFHAQRAVFLARAHGLDAIAFAADDPPRRALAKARLREVAARTLAVADVALGTSPRHLGPPVEVAARRSVR